MSDCHIGYFPPHLHQSTYNIISNITNHLSRRGFALCFGSGRFYIWMPDLAIIGNPLIFIEREVSTAFVWTVSWAWLSPSNLLPIGSAINALVVLKPFRPVILLGTYHSGGDCNVTPLDSSSPPTISLMGSLLRIGSLYTGYMAFVPFIFRVGSLAESIRVLCLGSTIR
jgi:hypothetical protein